MADAWGTPGWTVQNPTFVGDSTTTTAAQWPSNVVQVTVTAKFFDGAGQPLLGYVRFIPSVGRVVDGDSVIYLEEVVAKVDKGNLSVSLLATDDAALSPAFTWKVKECFPGGRDYGVLVPSSSVSPVNLFSLPAA